MELNKVAVIKEVRGLTSYPEEIISPTEMETMYQAAVEDVTAILGMPLSEVESPQTKLAVERSVFWSLCLFTKIHTGEFDGVDFKIGSISIDQMPSRDITRVWYRNLDQFVSMLQTRSSGGQITKVARNDRVYGE